MLLVEIAREARVSPATVSRAINQPDIVSLDTLERIREVIRRFNYIPVPIEHRRGPKARLGAQRTVGLWFVGSRTVGPELAWFREHLLEIQATDVRYRLDLRLLTSSTPDELPRGLDLTELDGLIIQGMEPSPALQRQIADIPHVWFMTRRSPGYAGDYIEPNNEENGWIAANYLHERKHRTVAVVATDPDYSAIGLRQQAFTARARELGLTVHTLLGRPTHTSYLRIAAPGRESSELAARLLSAVPRATGLYLPADHSCGAFFRALSDAGQRPGRDFEAVLGSSNPIIYRNLDHSPAAIDINLPVLVRKVVDHLLWRIENPKATGRIGISVSPRLITPAFANP
jgi:DNA-binding LacI/PurR family transcriptional regulator